MPRTTNLNNLITTMPIDYLLSIDVGTKNFAYCLLNVKTSNILRWNVISIESSTHEGSCRKLAEHLDKLKLTKVSNGSNGSNSSSKVPTIVVVIEQQPKVNIKTIIISGQVQMYFVLEKMSYAELTELNQVNEVNEVNEVNSEEYCKIVKIVGYHARNKLKYYKPQTGDEPIVLNCKKGYYKNKKMSIEHTKRILAREESNKKWLETLNSSKKKDDLADAFLQGRSYILERIKS